MAVRSSRAVMLFAAALALSALPSGAAAPAKAAAPRSIPLPGAPPTGVVMDFIAYDQAHGRLWVPAGNTGSVDVIDTATDKVTRLEGFPTLDVERNGTRRTMGPSSAVVGDSVVYVGSRGDNSVCAMDAVSLKKGACVKLDGMPDALAVVKSAHELWVSTPRTNTIVVLDTSKPDALTVKQSFTTPGNPECFVVDEGRGIVYTNLEDKDRTVAIDAATRKITKTWMPNCGEDGPKGLALDQPANMLFVACPASVRMLDAGHDGKLMATVEVGDGVDAIDYVAARHELFAGASRAAKLVVARLDPKGTLTTVDTIATAQSARNPVATDKGVAYLTDAHDGSILVVERAH